MAIKVISKEPDQSVIQQIICKNCGAKLEYTPNDIKKHSYVCMGDPSGDTYISCPVCKKNVIISEW